MNAPSWGPWAPNLDPIERAARYRVLRAVSALILGPRDRLGPVLAAAIDDPAELDHAAIELPERKKAGGS